MAVGLLGLSKQKVLNKAPLKKKMVKEKKFLVCKKKVVCHFMASVVAEGRRTYWLLLFFNLFYVMHMCSQSFTH